MSPIYLHYPLNPDRFRIYTEMKIRPSQWDEQKQTTQPKKKADKDTFWEDTATYLQEEKINLTAGSYNKVQAVLNQLKKFEENTKYKVRYTTINQNFYQRFLAYSVEELNHVNNTIGKDIKAIKRFLNYGLSKGWHNCTEHKKEYFKALKEEIDVVTLKYDELKTLINYEATTRRHKVSVDMFIFGCLTGMRIDDIQKLSPHHIINNQIHYTTGKNRKVIRVLLTDLTQKQSPALPHNSLYPSTHNKS